MASKRAPKKLAYHHGDLRSALLQAAKEMIRRDGAATFSLREAARAVGVDPAACYRHFHGRQELLVAVAQDGFGQLANAFEAALQASQRKRPRARLIALGQAYVAFALAAPAEFRVMFGEAGLPARDQRMRPEGMVRSPYELLLGCVTEYLEASPRRLRPDEVTLMLWTLAHGVARLVLDGSVAHTSEEAQALVERLAEALLDGLG